MFRAVRRIANGKPVAHSHDIYQGSVLVGRLTYEVYTPCNAAAQITVRQMEYLTQLHAREQQYLNGCQLQVTAGMGS